MSTIQAIETRYAGCHFRSRLEARWAVFYDALGVKWEYEKEGYQLRSGWYLPDFWLPALGVWVEIKGQEPTDREIRLLAELSENSKARVFLFSGQVPQRFDPDAFGADCASFDEGLSSGYWWGCCQGCGRLDIFRNLGFLFSGPRGEIHFGTDICRCGWNSAAPYAHANPPSILKAYTAARSARF